MLVRAEAPRPGDSRRAVRAARRRGERRARRRAGRRASAASVMAASIRRGSAAALRRRSAAALRRARRRRRARGSSACTTIAGGPSSGHLYSQMPQPMQRLGDHLGAREVVLRAVGPRDEALGRSSTMALSGTGHISWQTTQGVSCAQGRQRFRSMTARPMHLLALLVERRAWGSRPTGTRGRRPCTSSRSSRGASRAPASRAPRGRPARATAAGRRWGRPSCTRCSAGSARGRRPRPGRPAGG